jgi:hypothetical protein
MTLRVTVSVGAILGKGDGMEESSTGFWGHAVDLGAVISWMPRRIGTTSCPFQPIVEALTSYNSVYHTLAH